MNFRQTLTTILSGLLAVMFMVAGTGTAAAQGPCGESVTVVYGDTLGLIADRCDTTVTALLQENPEITNPNLIYVGQVLEMPDTGDEDEPERPPSGAAVEISPNQGPPGTLVTLSAANLTPNAQVEIGFGRVNSEYSIITQASTDADGDLNRSVAIPNFVDRGDTYVFVVQDPGMGDELISQEFLVTGEEAVMDPQVAISPRSGPAGSNVQVTASGFPPNTRVSYGLGEPNSEAYQLASARTNGNGSLAVTAQVPEAATAGTELVALVYVPQQQGARATSARFTVTEENTGDGNLFTRTNIYLVALQDAGRSGQEIGCGDSIVPVEVTIEPTIAPLTAALETLFSIDERFYGQSGLYNALYQSNLAVDGINIEGGVATINLTGDLLLGGVCDNPRVSAQLEETALQYYTVDEVQINVNGEPLASLLSGR